VGPQRLQRLGHRSNWPMLQEPAAPNWPTIPGVARVFGGTVYAPYQANVIIFVGLFTDPLPEGRPRSCALVTEPGAYQMPIPSDGTYYLFGAAIHAVSRTTAQPEPAPLWVAAAETHIQIRNGIVSGSCDLVLRPPHSTDPPIVVSLVALLADRVTV